MQDNRKTPPKATTADEARPLFERPRADTPVFDKGEEGLPWPEEAALPADDEGNILPGNDPLDEDPNDNGAEEQFDPEDLRRAPLPDTTPAR